MSRSLFALILSTFALGLSEFMPMGLLPGIADNLSVSIPKAGMLITAYAVGVMVASPIMTLLLSPLSKKRALIILLVIFTFGNLLSMLATGYASLLISRLITSLAHGSFFGIGAILAISLTPPKKQAGAVSLMFMGLTIANIGGVPMAAWVGEMVGFRAAFMGTTILGVAAVIVMMINIPQDTRGAKADVKREIKALVNPQVLIIFIGTVMFAGSLFTLYTYIAVVLEDLAGATPAFVAVMLSVIGIGFTLGSIIGGRLAISWSIDKALVLFFFSAAVIMFLYPLVARNYLGAGVATLLWGVAGYGASPLLQTKIVEKAKEAPALASSVNIGIFNLGNALGAVVGGGVLTAGLGYGWIAPAGGVLSILGMFSVLIPMVKSTRLKRKYSHEQVQELREAA